MSKKWQIYQANEEKVEEISKKYKINKLLATILSNRDITEKEQIEKFLNPKRNDFYNPYEMLDMEIAVKRIIKAIEDKEKIIIYGDYDVDGITSSTVLHRFLEERGLHTDIYIPNRLNEGYGLNKKEIEAIAETKHTLIITVDCGITGYDEIEYAKTFGIDTVVTDHHEPPEKLPDAIAVVDCKRKDNKYPFNGLAGVGVAFKLTQALAIKLNLPEESYLKYLDIVCVGTISDIVPLVDENRTISKLGLRLVKQTRNIGLKVLLESIGYKKIDSNTISFGIAPRINACGRMGHEKEALKLFLTNNIEEAKQITQKLNEYNLQRQEIEKRIFDEAQELMQNPEEQKLPCIVLRKENWHHGVIGIVSSKITDMYFKPSILMCIEDKEAKGSGRSIPGFDIHEALENCKENIKQFGGHSMAIGITIDNDKFADFKKQIEEYAESKQISEIVPVLNIDEKVQLKNINLSDIKDLELLEPFGEANKPPIFQINNLKIESIRTLTQGKHLKLDVKEENTRFSAIGFNLGNLANDYKIGDKVNIAGFLEINSFNGMDSIQINIKDIMKSIS